MPNVAFVRKELKPLLSQYRLIGDAVAGEQTVKAARTLYLPKPNAEDTSPENGKRYDAYLKRAVYYNATRRTLFGLIGQVYSQEPVIEVPSLLKPVVNNASGKGESLVQHSKRALSLALAYSRAGLFVDYPEAPEGATIADLEAGRIRPTLTLYKPEDIINWRVIDRGADEILSLIVLREPYEFDDDGFEVKTAIQFRVLRIEEASGFYRMEIWREKMPTETGGLRSSGGNFELAGPAIYPKDASGRNLTEIPFTFIGSENNDPLPEEPNFYDIASVNLAHYRNSADYEESCYVVGQPTPVLIGLTEEWVNNVLKGTVTFGSRGAIPLPQNADAKLLQAEPNTMIKEAMDAKERQLVALGAKLVEQTDVQRTATEAKIEATSEGSILSSTAKNVQAAYMYALEWCARFVGVEAGSIKFELNTDFDISRMSNEERGQTIKEWQAGAITFTEMRSVLRKAGTATEDDEKAKADIAKDTAEAMALEAVANEPGLPAGNNAE